MGSPILVLSGLIFPHNILRNQRSRSRWISRYSPPGSRGINCQDCKSRSWKSNVFEVLLFLVVCFPHSCFKNTFVVKSYTTKKRVKATPVWRFKTDQLVSDRPMAHRGWQTTRFGFVVSLPGITFQFMQIQLRFFSKRCCPIGCAH